MIPTKLDMFKWQFDMDCPRFLNEVIANSNCRMYAGCWNVLISLLGQVATRATELNDPILNILMLRLNLYDVPTEERQNIIEQIRKGIENGNQETDRPNHIGKGD